MIRSQTDRVVHSAEKHIHLITRLAVSTYLFWAGLFLVLAPWMASWDHNFFVDAVPALELWTRNQFVRGAVTGIGLITAAAGVRDMAGVFMTRTSEKAGEKIAAP